MTDWLIEAARRPTDCSVLHDVDPQTLTCRRCGEKGQPPQVFLSGGTVDWGKVEIRVNAVYDPPRRGRAQKLYDPQPSPVVPVDGSPWP